MATAPAKKKRGRLFRRFRALLGLFVLLAAFIYFVYVLPFWGIPFNQSRHGRVPLTPPWALECWLWEDDVNTGAYVKELLAGYARHDFPVRTILIDSPWSWRYNDFKVDENRYPEPEKFFRGLQDQGYRVVLWMTCMVDSHSKDTRITESQAFHDEAQTNGYLAGGGTQITWWKGTGGFLDYSNPEAMKWWHNLQQQMLDWGVDGWKLDGCDTFFSGRLGRLPVPFNRTHSGWMTTRQYMDHYARDEYQHGLTHNPEFTGKHGPHILRIFAKEKPARITLDGQDLPEGAAWKFDAAASRIIIKTRNYTQGRYLIVQQGAVSSRAR